MYAKALIYKSHTFLIYIVKISIIAISFYFIYSKLALNDSLSLPEFWSVLKSSAIISLNSVLFVGLLSVVNWFLEILKWQNLVNAVKSITLKSAIAQTLGSHTASLFTPNRIGDYGAKALYFPSNLRAKIMGLNGLGNLAQMCVTTFFGSIGLIFFTKAFPINFDFKTLHWSRYLIFGLLCMGLILVVKTYLKPETWILKTKRFLSSISLSLLGKTLLFSTLRYLVFSFQFYFLLQLFNIDLGYLNTMMIISSLYLLASILPSIFIFDVVLKGSIAVYLFSFFNINETIVLSCITLMWLFNTVLPSVLGSYYVMSFKGPKL
ncbi:hypothetical protein ACFFVB_00980 [Formosa undariae]|uniref:Flippase-like domain-containing protein n=1 Tax=Formosa undariae TaxID=1325436 RepID=A0ABV5EXG0_9FLAO